MIQAQISENDDDRNNKNMLGISNENKIQYKTSTATKSCKHGYKIKTITVYPCKMYYISVNYKLDFIDVLFRFRCLTISCFLSLDCNQCC